MCQDQVFVSLILKCLLITRATYLATITTLNEREIKYDNAVTLIFGVVTTEQLILTNIIALTFVILYPLYSYENVYIQTAAFILYYLVRYLIISSHCKCF